MAEPHPLSWTRIIGSALTIAAHAVAAVWLSLPAQSPDHDRQVVHEPAGGRLTLELDMPAAIPVLLPPPPPPPPEPAPTTQARQALRTSPKPAAAERPDKPPAEILSYRRTHQPHFPMEARRAGEAGWVTIRVLVDEAGVPQAFEVVRSTATARLVEAALAAVKQWRFSPAIKDGRPVPAWVEVPIGFLNSRAA